ncbi:MAG: peroxiredoxin [Deltaproteobacteria bacterium]|nr:peroxiredoxin [Deltaproteobacteria bacterium]
MAKEAKVKVGGLAPDFTLPDQEGKQIRLKDFLGKKNIVLYFYPKDETPGCTKEACAFRDSYEVFKTEEAEVIGVSSDATSSHLKFAAHHRLPFILLSDEGGKVRKLYGVASTMGVIPGRVTYVIDKKGIIRHVFSSQFNAVRHVEEALKILKSM